MLGKNALVKEPGEETDKSRRRKKNKSRRHKRDKSRRRKKKTKFSAGNKIADKKLSKAAKAWRKASMDCFAENEKARRKVSKHEEKLIKCSRNLTLSRELLKASKKKKFRNGDGEKKSGKKPKLVFNDPKSLELMSKLEPVKKKPGWYVGTKGWMHHPRGFGTQSDK